MLSLCSQGHELLEFPIPFGKYRKDKPWHCCTVEWVRRSHRFICLYVHNFQTVGKIGKYEIPCDIGVSFHCTLPTAELQAVYLLLHKLYIFILTYNTFGKIENN